jgi:hypothetical protein
VENIADQWSQKIFYAGRKKKGKEEKGGKKEKGGKRKEGKERKEGKGKKEKKGQKKNRKKKESNCTNNHFVQGQILGVGGAPQIISERTLIA